MSDTSSDDSSVPEVRKQRKRGNKKSKKDEKNSGKVQRSPLFMCVDVSEKELKYRQKHFQDEQKIVSAHRIYCTACGVDMKHLMHDGREVFNHPVLKVLMCKSCVKFYGDGSFSPDEDGSDRFCRWCAQGGTLYCCAECTCAFCKKCIKNNLKRSILDDIEEEDWKCFVCNVKPLWELRAVCAAAQSCANRTRRNKRREIGENLKELQKKLPERTQNRRSNRWQTASNKTDGLVETNAGKKRKRHRSTSSDSEPDSADHKDKKQKGRRKTEDIIQIGSSDGEAEQNKSKSNQTKKQPKEKKRYARETNSDDSSIAAKLRKKDTASRLQKQNKEKLKDKSSKKIEQYGSTKGNVSDRSKPKRLLKNASNEDEGNSCLPKITDKDTAQWFCNWLKDLGQDIIDQSNLCSSNVTKFLEKKVTVEKMMDSKTAEKTVTVLQTLIELTSENLERAKGLLTLNHKYWKSRVIKVSKELLHDDDDDDDDNNDNSDSDDDKPLKSRKTMNEERSLRPRKQIAKNLSEVSSSESEEERIVIKKKSKSKKKNTNSVAEVANQTVTSKQIISDSDETHLSGAENKIDDKQKASKKVEDASKSENKKPEDASKSQNKEVESSSSKDRLCNGINEVPQNDSAASSSEDCTMNEGLAAKLCNENLEDVSKDSKKNLEENDKTSENQECSSSENTEEQQKGLENGSSSSPSKKESENADESMRTNEEEGKQQDTTLNEAAVNSSEDQSNISAGNLEETSAPEEKNLMDASEDILDATEKITQENNTENKQKPTKAENDDKSSSNKEHKKSKESDKAGSDGEGKGKSSEGDTDEDARSVCSADTLECVYSNEQEASPKDVKKDTSQTTEKENNSDVESSQKSFSVDIKEEKIVSSQEAKLLEKIDLNEEVVDKEEKDPSKDEENCKNKNETAQNDDSKVAENKKDSTTASEKNDENIQEVPAEEKPEEESKYTEGGCKAQQSLLGYSSDDENDGEENEEDSDGEKTKKKKRKKGKSAGITDTSTPLKKKTESKSKRSKKGDDLLPSDIDSEDSEEEEENLENRRVKSKIKPKKEEDKQKAEATKEAEDCSDSSDKEDAEKKQAKDKDIKSLINMKTLKKRGRKATDDSEDESDTDADSEKKKRKAKRKKKVSEITETLMDFLNKDTEDEDDDDSDSDDLLKNMRQKSKNLREKQNELAKKMMMENTSSDEEDDEEEEEEEEEQINKKTIKKEKEKVTDDKKMKVEEMDVDEKKVTADEEKEPEPVDDDDDDEIEVIQIKDKNVNEILEISSDKEDEDSADDAKEKEKGKSWRKDKLLTMKLADTDTSDEEEKWKAKKKRIKEESSSGSEDESKSIRKPKKNNRRRIVASDDEPEIISSDSSSSSLFEPPKSKKSGRNKKSGSENSSDSDSDAPKPKKAARKRIKALNNSSSGNSSGDDLDTSQKMDSQSKGRKNIRKVMKDESVGEATRRAAKEEEERKKRIIEKQMLYNEIFKEKGVETIDKLVLDFDPETKKELVAVHPYLVQKLKPHQVKGVKFMWESCFESLKQIKKTKGSGCILAHCMGLGKTLQVVALLHTLLTHKATKVHTAMVVCPLSTVQNWVNEFNMWLKEIEDTAEVNVYELSRYKQNYERMYQLNDWQEEGGVLVIGYDMYRNLSNPTGKRLRKKVIESFQRTLVEPGPDIVVCDEGHLLKNEDTALSKAMRRIKTLRRIVLTGTPLQNNLKEYHCMVQFVKPNLLGTRKEFLNRFVNPISNGQFEDSTAHDVKIMKRRAHVLHKMLEGSVQRFDYAVLTPFLPPKYEYVIAIRLTETQIKIYRHYLENYSMRGEKGKGAKLFTDFQNLQRIWTHPRVLQMSADKAEKIAEKKRLMESDSEGSLRDFIDDSDVTSSESESKTTEVSDSDSDIQVLNEENGTTPAKPKKTKFARTTRSRGLDAVDDDSIEKVKGDENDVIEEETTKPGEWWRQFIQGDEMENLKESGKLIMLFSILQECEKIGDKVLLFSQSLYSLDLIEYFLARIDAATQDGKEEESLAGHTGSWSIGLDYFRLDGSTPGETRNVWCKAFNREDNTRARLFLISTRAGGLGINLYAANRVIIFDASWNPSHDVQSIFRVYRFGQKKPCYIYRFLAQGTMEEKIYDRQVTKLSLSCRVVDEQQIERYYKMADLQELYQFDPEQKTKRPTPILPKDRLLAEMLKAHEQWIDNYHEHDSLLENVQEEELNEEERKAAWEEYENEKQGKINVAGFGYLNNMGFAGQIPNTNIPALREALKKQNPTATDEQIENQLRTMVNQLRMYLNNMQASTSVPNQNYTTYNPQMNQMNQVNPQLSYIQQQQQTYQRMLQQQQQYAAGMNWNQSLPQFGQNLQEGQQSPFATGVYRNMVPTNPPQLASLLRPNVTQKSNQATGRGDMLISREPVVLPVNKTLQMHRKLVPINPPAAHASSRYFPTKGVGTAATVANQKKTESTKTFSNEDIETID